MSVSRRASFAAGIAAVRRDRRKQQPGGFRDHAASDSHSDANTITVVAGAVQQPQPPQQQPEPPAAAAAVAAAAAISAQDQLPLPVILTPTQEKPSITQTQPPPPASLRSGKCSIMDITRPATAFAAVAKAATVAARRPRIQYEVRPFTRESLEKINIRTNNLIRDYGFLPKRSPNLADGAQLPAKYEPFPPNLLGRPVEELDQYVYEKTFCVVSRRFQKHYVQRFSATRAIWIFQPWNKFRSACVYLCTNQYFDYVVMFTILINCIFLAMTTPMDEAEYLFLGIYTLEMLIKCVARGFILNNYTYLRNPWNWLDFTVIFSGYLTSFIEMGNLAGLRTFRVLRALKTVSIMPSLKTIINALLNAVKQLAEVMTLTIFCLMVFALFALQVYMGQLRNKCVLEMDSSDNRNWTEWILDSDHWHYTEKGPELCGNSSGARSCPHGYVCLPNVGDNPNFGYTSFDNLLWSMLTTFQLITLDYWENVYNMIVATGGPIHVIFFTIVVFFGSFYLINLMLAVVAMSYEEEAEANNAERAKEADEAAQAKRNYPGEECTIRTNPRQPPTATAAVGAGAANGGGGSGAGVLVSPVAIPQDMCGNCQEKAAAASGSLEAIHMVTKAPTNAAVAVAASNGAASSECAGLDAKGAAGGSGVVVGGPGAGAGAGAGGGGGDKSYVVIKARHKDGQIKAVEGAGAEHPAQPAFFKGRDRIHSGRSSYKAEFNLTVPIHPSPSLNNDDVDDPRNLLSPPLVGQDGRRRRGGQDQSSLSNYSSASESSIRSSINDSGVFAEADVDSASQDKLRVQIPLSNDKEEIINCQSKERRPSKIDIPFVVSIETGNDRNCPGCRSWCIDYELWLRFQNALHVVVHDMLFDSTVTLCIVLNTAFLAAEHHGMSEDLKHVLDIGNKVFTSFFTLEAVLKLMALSKEYFASGWNIFDLIIVIASLIDLSVESVNGISVLRGMRLMRVLKLAQSWTTMKVLLSIIISTLGALGNLTFLLIIVIYIFAVLGMQLFGNTYTAENFHPDPVPRWNFTDFFHSFMMIFRILCGEWIEPLWDCMRAEAKVGVAESCLAIFLPALVMGNFMVLNLFLALLLNSFNCEELKSRKESLEKDGHERKDQKMRKVRKNELKKKKGDTEKRLRSEEKNLRKRHCQEVKGESGSIVTNKLNKLKSKMLMKRGDKLKQKAADSSASAMNLNSNAAAAAAAAAAVSATGEDGGGGGDVTAVAAAASGGDEGDYVHMVEDDTSSTQQQLLQQRRFREEGPRDRSRSEQDLASICQSKSLTFEEVKKDPREGESSRANTPGNQDPEPCCPEIFNKMFSFCTCLDNTWCMMAWNNTRKVIHDIVDNPFFEWTILLLIFASSLSLCFEDINLQDNEELMFILKIVNLVFAVLFTIEMVLKWIAFGLFRYFTSMWTCLDFVIVCVSVLSLAIEGSANLTALRSLRTLRALRPLRAISRWQGMKIVVNALMYAIPSIFNVLLVCLVFWLIFSIMGVQFFGGKFYKCVDDTGTRLDVSEVADKFECRDKNLTWINSKITFDHVGHAYLALFQVATFEGWMEVMADAVDAREVDQQPEREASIYNYFYFVIFIVCGSFFTLNLFIGVIIDNFNMLKKQYEGGVLEMFLTESQKNYYTAMKKLGRKKPQKVIRRPANEIHAVFYDISLSRRFEIAIFVLIFLNMVSMGIEHYNQSRVITFTLEICNALFTTIFSLEAIVKIIGLRFQYFTAGWNIFDFVLVIASIVGIVMEDMMDDFPVSPTLLRVVRVFRIGRILRLIKAAKGIRKLLFALMVSLPALFNIGALLALITFIYAIIGMTLFGHVKHQGALNDQVNFETFGRSMQLLFRLVTSAGWNDVLDPLLVTPPKCDPNYKGLPNGNCGHPFVAIVYFVSFIIINFMIVINMYIAIILENFNQAHQEEEIGIVEEDLEMFYTKWSKYDPHATQFITFNQMSDFIASLDAPLGIAKPNTLALVSFDLPIAKGDKIHCLDVLHALTKYTLGFVDDGSEDFSKLAAQMDDKFKKQFPTRKELEIVSSTREWKRLDNAARIITRFFREIKRARATGERVNIHTQTRRAAPAPAEKDATRALYKESDIDWKTHSLPSLGRVSSDNTFESSGDDYAIRRSVRRTKKTRKEESRRSKSMNNEDDGVETRQEEEGEETERTHNESEELDHFEGYSLNDNGGMMSGKARRTSGLGASQKWRERVETQSPHHILKSYSEEPPPPSPTIQRTSQTSLEAFAEPVPPDSLAHAISSPRLLRHASLEHPMLYNRTQRHPFHKRSPSTGSYQQPGTKHVDEGLARNRFSYSDYQQIEMEQERGAAGQGAQATQRLPMTPPPPRLSLPRAGGAQAGLPPATLHLEDPFTSPSPMAVPGPMISPNNPGHSIVHVEKEDAALDTTAHYRPRRRPRDEITLVPYSQQAGDPLMEYQNVQQHHSPVQQQHFQYPAGYHSHHRHYARDGFEFYHEPSSVYRQGMPYSVRDNPRPHRYSDEPDFHRDSDYYFNNSRPYGRGNRHDSQELAAPRRPHHYQYQSPDATRSKHRSVEPVERPSKKFQGQKRDSLTMEYETPQEVSGEEIELEFRGDSRDNERGHHHHHREREKKSPTYKKHHQHNPTSPGGDDGGQHQSHVRSHHKESRHTPRKKSRSRHRGEEEELKYVVTEHEYLQSQTMGRDSKQLQPGDAGQSSRHRSSTSPSGATSKTKEERSKRRHQSPRMSKDGRPSPSQERGSGNEDARDHSSRRHRREEQSPLTGGGSRPKRSTQHHSSRHRQGERESYHHRHHHHHQERECHQHQEEGSNDGGSHRHHRTQQQQQPQQQQGGEHQHHQVRRQHDPRRQSIRRQAQVVSMAAPPDLPPPAGAQSDDVSDAFDDDGLFHFEEGDHSDCRRK